MEGISAWLASRGSPTRRDRLMVSVGIGLLGALFCYTKYLTMPDHPGDFGLAWFGARAMLHGKNPYALVGPGLEYDWPWPLVYPATAFVIAIPFAMLPLLAANMTFTFLSSFLLSFSMTKDGWAKLPIFGSAAFIVAAGAAQWSPLLTAAVGLPIIGFFFAGKPTIGLALALTGTRRLQLSAMVGAAVIGIVSLVIFPGWIGLWRAQLHFAFQMAPPFFRWGGPSILIALLRWRHPEARLLLALGCIPQVGSWYEALPVFLVPKTYNESMGLAFASLIGFQLMRFLPDGLNEKQINDAVGSLMVASVYLPAIIIILRRPSGDNLSESRGRERD